MIPPIDMDAVVCEADNLDPLPDSVVRLSAITANEGWDIREVVATITYDEVLTSLTLRAANSAAYGGASCTTTIRDAIVRLGLGTVVSLAVGAWARKTMRRAIPEYGLSERGLWRHSVAAALAAETAVRLCWLPAPPESFTAALLHDLGKLVLARFLTPELIDLLRRTREEGGLRAHEAEEKVLTLHHGVLSGVIVRRWNLPDSIVRGVTYHHAPDDGRNLICDVVHLADVIANRVSPTGGAGVDAELQEGARRRLQLAPGHLSDLCGAAGERLDNVLAMYE